MCVHACVCACVYACAFVYVMGSMNKTSVHTSQMVLTTMSCSYDLGMLYWSHCIGIHCTCSCMTIVMGCMRTMVVCTPINVI